MFFGLLYCAERGLVKILENTKTKLNSVIVRKKSVYFSSGYYLISADNKKGKTNRQNAIDTTR